MTQEMVGIELSDGNSSALFTMPENAAYRYVVMPMRI
jgi:DNA polymerase-3 subunit beta